MILLTDNQAFARRCIPQSDNWQACQISSLTPSLAALATELFDCDSIMQTEIDTSGHWNYLFMVNRARKSQYDLLSSLATSGCDLPDRIVCCAGSGDEFHGFKSRSWEACEGNIHLSAFVRPEKEIPGAAVGFMMAAVIAALQTVESYDLQGATPAIKWVNDVLIHGSKVGGVLARLQTQGRVTESAVVGIGINIEQSPPVQRDPFVPRVAALSDFTSPSETCSHPDALPRLLEFLEGNLDTLEQGHFTELLDLYRRHSMILGRRVIICEDSKEASSRVLARGRVESIGPSLELIIDGIPDPVTKGRLRLENDV
jgi:biotin-[acetyl-CoA-carboxylase] ligase BirA-like protein